MSHPAATVTGPQLLQAQAKVVSAREKIIPPWQMPWPLTMSSRTVMVARAQPSPWSSSVMPSVLEAASDAIIDSTGPGWPTGCDMVLPR